VNGLQGRERAGQNPRGQLSQARVRPFQQLAGGPAISLCQPIE
jgi:hypothetical protein